MKAHLIGWCIGLMVSMVISALIGPDAVIAAICQIAPILVAPGNC